MNYLKIILVILGIIALLNLVNGYTEAFTLINPSSIDDEQILLGDSYIKKDNNGHASNGYLKSIDTYNKKSLEELQKKNSIKSDTNNIKFDERTSPDNNSCTPLEFCDTFYGNRKSVGSIQGSPINNVSSDENKNIKKYRVGNYST